MSSFNGRVIELPGVIVDHFVSSNVKEGRFFFLSHCHKDHMEGISSPEFVRTLKQRCASLYCSEVTKALLRCDPECSILSPCLKALPMADPVSLSSPNKSVDTLALTVTLLPAGHCPGSVMFLFQTESCNVLYTGDFRLTIDDVKQLPSLHHGPNVIDLDALYLDTTFCHPKTTRFPSRETSRDEVLLLMERWLAKSERHVVLLDCKCFGYEHIFLGVYQKFGMKVHINQWRYEAYRELPAVLSCVTATGSDTRVHACRAVKGQKLNDGLPCGALGCGKSHPHVLRIKPSTMFFGSNSAKFNQMKVFVVPLNMWRVLHSMHASYSEIREFVQYLKPKSVVPCVVTGWDSTVLDVVQRLKDLIRVPAVFVQDPQAIAEPSVKGEAIVKCEGVRDEGDTRWSSEDDTDSEYASELDSRKYVKEAKKLDKGSIGLPSMLVSSPTASQSRSLPLLLSPVHSSRLQDRQEGSSKHTGSYQTSLELSDSVETDASLDADRRQQCVTQHRKRVHKHPSHDVSSSDVKRACTPASHTSKTLPCMHKKEEVIDLTLSPSSSASSVEAMRSPLPSCDHGNQDSQGSSQSWLPATPDVASTVRTIAFDDL